MAQADPGPDPDTLIDLIRAKPGMTLLQLVKLGPSVLARVRVGDLRRDAIERERVAEQQREAARVRGPAFDRLVLEAVRQGEGPVASSFVRERVGGPRWKLQMSLGRLVAAGKLQRTGSTSTTRYTITSG